MINVRESKLMKNFKVEELEQRLEMDIWGGGSGKPCYWTSEATGITYIDANCDGASDDLHATSSL